MPYLPTRSLHGSDLLAESEFFHKGTNPVSGEQVVLVPAIEPDWAIVHVQRADSQGNAHFWGNTGITEPAVGAARNVLVAAEEIVEPAVIKSDPSRVLVTREQVAAVVECPYGAHPSPLAGRYDRDNGYYLRYRDWSKTQQNYDEWAAEWVHRVAGREEYLDLVEAVPEITRSTIAAVVTYGQ